MENGDTGYLYVLELCCFEWFQNIRLYLDSPVCVLELCCFEWFQNLILEIVLYLIVLELCCFEWFQNSSSLLFSTTNVLELCCFEWFQNFDDEWMNYFTVLELFCFEWSQKWIIPLSTDSVARKSSARMAFFVYKKPSIRELVFIGCFFISVRFDLVGKNHRDKFCWVFQGFHLGRVLWEPCQIVL